MSSQASETNRMSLELLSYRVTFFSLSITVFRIVPRAFIVPVFHFEPLPAFAAGQFLPSSRQSSSGLAWDLGGTWTAPARAAGAPGSPCLSEVCRASFHKAGRPLPSTECGAADTEGAVCRPRLLRRSPPGGGTRRRTRRTVTSRHSGRQTDATWIEQTRTVGVCVYSLISPSYSEWTFFSKYTTLIVN